MLSTFLYGEKTKNSTAGKQRTPRCPDMAFTSALAEAEAETQVTRECGKRRVAEFKFGKVPSTSASLTDDESKEKTPIQHQKLMATRRRY